MPHPEGSIRAATGFDRVCFQDASSVDLKPGQGRQLTAALEDGAVRGCWFETTFHAPIFIVLSRVDCVTEFRRDTMAILDADDALYRAQEKAEELLNGGD